MFKFTHEQLNKMVLDALEGSQSEQTGAIDRLVETAKMMKGGAQRMGEMIRKPFQRPGGR